MLAMIIIMIPYFSFGAAAAHASDNDSASSAIETLPSICVSDGINKTFNFNCEGHSYTWNIQVPSDLVTWDRSIQDTLNAFYANGGSAQGSILKNAPDDVLQLIQATYPTTKADDTSWVDEPRNDAFVRQLSIGASSSGAERQF